MPRYYFNTRIGDELISDPDGEVLVDPDRAWEMARAMIRELLKTEGTGGALLNATIEVTDEALEMVVVRGYSMAYGARFLKRFIDEQIKLPISAQWKAGTHFDVKVKDGELVVEPAVAKMSTPDDTLAYGDVA